MHNQEQHYAHGGHGGHPMGHGQMRGQMGMNVNVNGMDPSSSAYVNYLAAERQRQQRDEFIKAQRALGQNQGQAVHQMAQIHKKSVKNQQPYYQEQTQHYAQH